MATLATYALPYVIAIRPRSFFAEGLPAAAKRAVALRGVAFQHLTAGIRINLGVEHEDVHVAAAGQHVIEAAEADVVGPAVAADDPDRLLHKRIDDRQKLLLIGRIELVHPRRKLRAAQANLQQLDPLPLLENLRRFCAAQSSAHSPMFDAGVMG
jgi:hypothetical protein